MSFAIADTTVRQYRFENLASACPDMTVQAHKRVDPFWGSLWSSGSSASWLSEDMAERQVQSGLGTLPAHLSTTKEDAWRKTFMPKRLRERLDILGVLDSWRTVTSEQLSCFTGQPELADGRSNAMRDLFSVGLADAGIFVNGLHHTRSAGRGTLYRPSRSDVFRKEMEPKLSYPEWVSVTGGYPFESGGQFDRHNLLATELTLRVAEYCEIGTVLGEKLSSFDLLAHSGLGFPSLLGSQHAADATFVRPDGARIAIEMTASAGATFAAKVERWAKLLANRRFADSGLMVMFVVAERPDKRTNRGETKQQVLKHIAKACRENPGVSFDRVADRMLIAEWTKWFPAPGIVDESFFSLTAHRPSGPPEAPWQRVSALDTTDIPFEPRNPDGILAIIDNASMLGGVPHWLRTGTPPPLWQIALDRTGWPEIPVPAPARPETYIGARVNREPGTRFETKPPKRLRTQR